MSDKVIYYTYPENFSEDVSLYDVIIHGNNLKVFPSDLDTSWASGIRGKELASVEDTGDGLCIKVDDSEIELSYSGLATLKVIVDAVERNSEDGVILLKRLIEDD